MTRRWHIGDSPTSLQSKEIAEALASGSVVLMPTDTIYGLHAVAANDAAVTRIAEMKGRDGNKPFIVLASSVDRFPELGITAPPEIVKALDSIWPAPLTAILPRVRQVGRPEGAKDEGGQSSGRHPSDLHPSSLHPSGLHPSGLHPSDLHPSGLRPSDRPAFSTVAVRIPALDWLRALIDRTGPLVSTSANRSGEPPVDRPSALARDLQNGLDIVDGGIRSGEPSAILDLTGPEPRFIREGHPSFTQKVWKTLRNSL